MKHHSLLVVATCASPDVSGVQLNDVSDRCKSQYFRHESSKYSPDTPTHTVLAQREIQDRSILPVQHRIDADVVPPPFQERN